MLPGVAGPKKGLTGLLVLVKFWGPFVTKDRGTRQTEDLAKEIVKSIASFADMEEVRKRFKRVTWKNTKLKAFCPPDTGLEPSKLLVAYLPGTLRGRSGPSEGSCAQRWLLRHQSPCRLAAGHLRSL